jgi:hypothetical protein
MIQVFLPFAWVADAGCVIVIKGGYHHRIRSRWPDSLILPLSLPNQLLPTSEVKSLCVPLRFPSPPGDPTHAPTSHFP